MCITFGSPCRSIIWLGLEFDVLGRRQYVDHEKLYELYLAVQYVCIKLNCRADVRNTRPSQVH